MENRRPSRTHVRTLLTASDVRLVPVMGRFAPLLVIALILAACNDSEPSAAPERFYELLAELDGRENPTDLSPDEVRGITERCDRAERSLSV